MDLRIEKSIDDNGLWVIDRETFDAKVLYRTWAMPAGGDFSIYELYTPVEFPSQPRPQPTYSCTSTRPKTLDEVRADLNRNASDFLMKSTGHRQ